MINVPSTFRVIAIISTFNEEDIIVPVINHLFNEGVSVYLIDNWSTDHTFELVNQLSHSLTGIERWPKDGPSSTYDWEEILKRKEVLSQTLNADWFMHYDADEIRESPWMGIKLKDAIYIVNQQGYNAIDFDVLNFHPVDNNYQPGSSPAEYFKYFLLNDFIGNELQIKAWKRQTERVNLSTYAGHLVEFAGRRVFPYKFIIRHYPIRSQTHGERKIFSERNQRFNPLERKRGWHIQYDNFHEGTNFLKDPADLLKFQPSFYDEFMIKQILEREKFVQQLKDHLTDPQTPLSRDISSIPGKIELEHKHRYLMDFSHSKIQKKISVVIPVYNGEKYIEKSIQSVAMQTVPPYEIIVVDDGSTDDSALIIAELSNKYFIKFFQKENGGQSSARNYGVRFSNGDLIAFLDQDDIWYPNHLEELVKPFLENSYPETGWVYSTVDEIGDNDELYRIDVLSVVDSIHPKKTIYQCLSADMFVIPSATMVLKKAFDDVGGFDERLSGYEDDDLFVSIFWKGYGNVFINKSLAKWRIHGGSCSWGKGMAISRIIYAKKLLETFQNDYLRRCNYRTDFILPRFIKIIIEEYKRGILFKNKNYANLMNDNLHELYPYMNFKMKLNCNIILFLQRHPLLRSILKPFVKIYLIAKRFIYEN